jgi:two-component system nitrate/nitrite response regulator NarL
LSRRELVILRTLTEGASNKMIALKLVITESTVKVHMKAILRKLRLQNRTQAAIWARTHLDELASSYAPVTSRAAL